jgi:hypothetical protein
MKTLVSPPCSRLKALGILFTCETELKHTHKPNMTITAPQFIMKTVLISLVRKFVKLCCASGKFRTGLMLYAMLSLRSCCVKILEEAIASTCQFGYKIHDRYVCDIKVAHIVSNHDHDCASLSSTSRLLYFFIFSFYVLITDAYHVLIHQDKLFRNWYNYKQKQNLSQTILF